MSGALLARKMAASKKRVDHVAWQIEVATNEEWDELTKLQGLVVVDVYSEWCGPCSAMASHLKEIKLQLGDDLLHCAIARSDGINQLSRFRGRSEPTWLFVAGGEPVALVRGANAPLIRTTLLDELEAEKQVLAGNRQRAVIPWESFDFGDGEKTDEQSSDANVETDKLPEDWTELDALVLQGSFRLILDRFVESCKNHPLEIVHRSAVHINQADSLILWFPSTLEEDKLVEWVDATMGELITDVEPKPEPEPVPENTEQNGEPSEEGEGDLSPQTPRAPPEPLPDYLPITYKLIMDHSDKETLIQKVAAEAAAAAADAATDDAADDADATDAAADAEPSEDANAEEAGEQEHQGEEQQENADEDQPDQEHQQADEPQPKDTEDEPANDDEPEAPSAETDENAQADEEQPTSDPA